MLLRRIARPLLASAFVVDGVDTLMHPERRVEVANSLLTRAKQASPGESVQQLAADPATLVRINAGAQVVAGALLALGRAPRAAALVLAATVVPAAVTEQDFWAEKDAERKAVKRAGFLKDVSLLGGLLIASADTGGKPSLGWRGRRAAQSAVATVSAALPIGAASNGATGEVLGERLHDTAIRARTLAGIAAAKGAELAEVAQVRGTQLAEVAKERGPELAEAAKERGAKLAEVAKERGPEWAEIARERGSDWAEVARERGPEFAATARKRGAHLVESVRDGAEPKSRWRR